MFFIVSWRCPTLKKNVSSILIKINEIIEDRNEVNKIITNPFIESKTYHIISFLSFLFAFSGLISDKKWGGM